MGRRIKVYKRCLDCNKMFTKTDKLAGTARCYDCWQLVCDRMRHVKHKNFSVAMFKRGNVNKNMTPEQLAKADALADIMEDLVDVY